MNDDFLFNEFSKQGQVKSKQRSPGELHSMPKAPENTDMPDEMKRVMEEGKQVVINMLRNGTSCEQTSKLTKLPLDYIQRIQKGMQDDKN